MLIVGLNFDNKLLEEIMETEHINGSLTDDPKLIDTIRYYHIEKMCPECEFVQIAYNKISLPSWRKILLKNASDNKAVKFDTIFLDYHDVSEDFLIATVKRYVLERVLSVSSKNTKIIAPFSLHILKLLNSEIGLQHIVVSFLQESDLSQSSHPLYYATSSSECQEHMRKYKITSGKGLSQCYDWKKEEMSENLTSVDGDVSGLKNLITKIDDLSNVMFMVIKRNDGDVTFNNSPVFEYLDTSNISAFRMHLKLLQTNRFLLCDQYCFKDSVDIPDSYSMMESLEDGYNLVVYTGTHHSCPLTLHKSLGLRIVLADGLTLIWNGNLVHSGGRSRCDSKKEISKDMRLFSYIWTDPTRSCKKKKNSSSREDGTNLHREKFVLCKSFDLETHPCNVCYQFNCPVLDLSKVNIANIDPGSVIFGSLDVYGWVVVRSVNRSHEMNVDLSNISKQGDWTAIQHGGKRFMKFNINSCDKNYREWMLNEEIQMHFNLVKMLLLDKFLPRNDYVCERRNLLINLGEIRDDQLPHCDFRSDFSK